MPTSAGPDRNATLAVKLLETFTLVAKATSRQRKLDYMREIPLVHCAGRFALAAAHGKLVVRQQPMLCSVSSSTVTMVSAVKYLLRLGERQEPKTALLSRDR
jgi:predicted NUDIX family NTP pyrophosphohydrolase